MISRENAIALAIEFMNREHTLNDDEYIIQDEYTVETEQAWVFRYDSKRYTETDNPMYAIMIHIPLYVDKATGMCDLRINNKD